MLPWWIKSLLITSVKSVKLYCRPSILASLVEFSVVMFALEVIWLSSLHAVVQLFCSFTIIRWFQSTSILSAELRGEVTYQTDGTLKTFAGKARPITLFSTRYSAVFLSITCGSDRYLLWRDSCKESDYRWIIFNEKRRRSAPVEH